MHVKLFIGYLLTCPSEDPTLISLHHDGKDYIGRFLLTSSLSEAYAISADLAEKLPPSRHPPVIFPQMFLG